jgi:hypothetical protein
MLFVSICNINTPGQRKETLGQTNRLHQFSLSKSHKCDIGSERVNKSACSLYRGQRLGVGIGGWNGRMGVEVDDYRNGLRRSALARVPREGGETITAGDGIDRLPPSIPGLALPYTLQ